MTRGAVVLGVVLMAGVASAARVTEVHYVMGTYFQIEAETVDETQARTALRRCFALTRHLEALFSRFDPHSELSRLNASAAKGGPVTVSAEMAALLDHALELRAATDGAFDVGVGALTQLWRNAADWPNPARINAAQQTAGASAFALYGSTLDRRPGAVIDLDGIAKGWAVDRCVAELRAGGITRALLNLGESSLYALGAPAHAQAWPVVLRSLDSAHALGTLRVRDQAVSVSAVFGHERQIGTMRVGHIVDPRSGRPLTSPAMAVVVAASATDAEAFSKALLILGQVPRHAVPCTGTLLVGPAGVRRSGRVDFTRLGRGQPIAATVEALR